MSAYGTNSGQDFTLLANTDMSANQFKFVTLQSTGFILTATAGQRATGVLQDDQVGSSGTPRGCQVRMFGETKVLAGGSYNKGDLLSSDSQGRAVRYTGATVFTGTPYTVSGTQVLGVALEAGSSGQVAAMLFQPSGLAA